MNIEIANAKFAHIKMFVLIVTLDDDDDDDELYLSASIDEKDEAQEQEVQSEKVMHMTHLGLSRCMK